MLNTTMSTASRRITELSTFNVNTEMNLADLLTKPLTRIKHTTLAKMAGLCSLEDKGDGMQEEGGVLE